MPSAKKAASEARKARYLKAIIFGPPGHGKTHLLGTAVFDPRTSPIAILDFEGGVSDVLDGLPGGPDGPDWYHIPIASWDDYSNAFERLLKNEEGFKCCAIDSLSETHIFALMALLDTKGSTRKEPNLIQQDDYGIALVQIRRLVREFRDLPMHVIYTSHHKEEDDVKDGRVKMVNLSGKAATEIPGLMGLVGYLALAQVKEEGSDNWVTVRSLLLQNYPKIRTKVRTPWGIEAPDEIDDPTISDILDALKYE